MAAGLIEVKFDQKKLDLVRQLLRDVPRAMPQAVSRAINKTAASCRTEITRRISAQAKVKQSAVRAGVTLRKATRRLWQATLEVTRKRIPLIKFGARQLKKGVTYKIEKSGGRKLIPSAFIPMMPSGHRGVFRRLRPTTKRLPIIELKGPSIGSLFKHAGDIARQVVESSSKKLEQNLDSQVRYILSKRSAK